MQVNLTPEKLYEVFQAFLEIERARTIAEHAAALRPLALIAQQSDRAKSTVPPRTQLLLGIRFGMYLERLLGDEATFNPTGGPDDTL